MVDGLAIAQKAIYKTDLLLITGPTHTHTLLVMISEITLHSLAQNWYLIVPIPG